MSGRILGRDGKVQIPVQDYVCPEGHTFKQPKDIPFYLAGYTGPEGPVKMADAGVICIVCYANWLKTSFPTSEVAAPVGDA
jgi:hypothetical protein